MKNLISVYFYVRPHKRNKANLIPIYCRITLNGAVKEFSIKKRVNVDSWDTKKQRLRGTKETARTINHQIDLIDQKITQSFNTLFAKSDKIELSDVLNHFNNESSGQTVLSVLKSIIEEKTSIRISNGRIKRYNVAFKKIQNFIRTEYRVSDLNIDSVQPSTFDRFKVSLLASNLCENTANTYLKILKMIGSYAYSRELISRDPFEFKHCTVVTPTPRFITIEDVIAIRDVELPDQSERLNRVRDLFLFMCYTGVAYCDLSALTIKNIYKGVNNQSWLEYQRQKTRVVGKVPLIPEALKLIKKYSDDPVAKERGTLFNVPSNQKLNDYLKLVADAAGVTKTVTCHVGRHTHATMALTFGMSMETIRKSLGQKSLKTTEIYSQVEDVKAAREMNEMNRQLNSEIRKSKNKNRNKK